MAFSRLRKFLSHHDIADNLTTNDATKVLSAKQGKALADTKVSNVVLLNAEDLNTILTSGFYRLAGSHANAPAEYRYSQMIVCRGADTIAQMIIYEQNGNVYVRSASGSGGQIAIWHPWQQLMTENNSVQKIYNGALAGGSQYTYTITSGHSYRVSMMRSGSCTSVLIDQWGSVAPVTSYSAFQITCANNVVTCKNTSGAYCNILLEDLGLS